MKIRKTKGVGSHHSLYPTSSPWVIMGYAMAKKKEKHKENRNTNSSRSVSRGEFPVKGPIEFEATQKFRH